MQKSVQTFGVSHSGKSNVISSFHDVDVCGVNHNAIRSNIVGPACFIYLEVQLCSQEPSASVSSTC